jgi:hypothetical protein
MPVKGKIDPAKRRPRQIKIRVSSPGATSAALFPGGLTLIDGLNRSLEISFL